MLLFVKFCSVMASWNSGRQLGYLCRRAQLGVHTADAAAAAARTPRGGGALFPPRPRTCLPRQPWCSAPLAV